jgi:hypothetical protein
MTHIEQALYDYLSPAARKEVDDYLALDEEAIQLMTRKDPILDEDALFEEARELRIRNTEPQDNAPSGAVKSE